MKLISIELYLYKPFLHHKTKHVVVTDINHVTVISGENACGKSSLLRACTPYPAVSTEFEKGGYKIAVYSHGGSIYQLTSDFRKSAGSHSFKKDGVELNESGTTEVQNGLVLEYLHYDATIEKLMTGKFQICDMGKPLRRELFMNTYPSSMAFILDYFKAVSTRLRAVNNNIKMLKQRQISLEQQLISPTILNDYKAEREDLQQACSKLNLDIYSVEKVIKSGQERLNQIDPAVRNYNQEAFIKGCKKIVRDYIELLNSTEITNEFQDTDVLIAKLQSRQSHLNQSLQADENAAKELKKELDEYRRCLSTNTESSIQDCRNQIAVQEKIIRNTVIDPEVPILSNSELYSLENDYQNLLGALSDIQHQTRPFWTDDEYSKAETQADAYEAEMLHLDNEYDRMKQDYDVLQTRLQKYEKLTWPGGCTQVCKLRENYSGIILTLKNQRDEISAKMEANRTRFKEVSTNYGKLVEAISAHKGAIAPLQFLSEHMRYHSWTNYVLEGQDLISALNRDYTRVYNRITHVLESSHNNKRVKEATELKTVLEAKLTSLESGSGQAQLLQATMIKKERQLSKHIDSIQKIKSDLLDIQQQQLNVDRYTNLMREIEVLNSKYQSWKQAYFLQAEIDYFTQYVADVNACKIRMEDKLRELEAIIKEQDNYLVRLNDEVLPELEKLQKLQTELAVVENQLSPTKGISHIYIIRYINAIFKLANQFISRVWSYPMQLAYIDEEDEAFDYTFKLVINETSSIKDISIASAGQKSILNLCVMLAICIFRHYSNDYPVILDEVTVNMSLNHQNNLITFLNELFADDTLLQVFIVDHCIDVCSSFASIAEMVCLSRDFDIGQEWKRIGIIE